MATTSSDTIAMDISSGVDQEAALQALLDVVARLEADPINIPLLRQHLEVARSSGMEEQVQKGLEMLCDVTAVGSALWLETLTNIYSSLQSLTEERLPSVLLLLVKASSDYASIPVLTFVAQILAACSGSPPKLEDEVMESDADAVPEATIRVDEEQARMIWKQTVSMADYDISQSNGVWLAYKDWEERIMLSLPEGSAERETQLKRMHEIWVARLATPHADHAETSQAYSSFNSAYSPNAYEGNMITATKAAQKPSSKYEARETWERGYLSLLAQPSDEPQTLTSQLVQQKLAYLYAYLEMEMAGGEKKTDWKMVQCVYERILAVLGDVGGKDGKVVEAKIWEKYGGYMSNANGPSRAQKSEVYTRAVRACPASGDLWAKQLRVQESTAQDPVAISETYLRALSLGELTIPVKLPTVTKVKGKGKAKATEEDEAAAQEDIPCGVTELVKLEMAWAGFMRRQEEGDDDMDDDEEDAVEATLRSGIAQTHNVDPRGDPEFNLEKFLISWLRRKGKIDEAGEVWEAVAKERSRSHRMWLAYTDFEIFRLNYSKARTLFKNAANKNVDWPEAIWEAWVLFEECYGSVADVETAKIRVATLSEIRVKKQMKEMQAQQRAAAYQAAAAPSEAPAEPVPQSDSAEVDSKKRKADGEAGPSDGQQAGTKRTRFDDEHQASDAVTTDGVSTKPTRDREHCTVFVAGLAPGTSEQSIQKRFIDCGAIREIVVTNKPDHAVATVEFVDKESVLAALTKDKKMIEESQINVYMAGNTTLFITNYPESADDESMRALFEPYGEILDTRWPSKKFKNTRRFLYLQYVSPASAAAALELHGRELEPGMPLSVMISEPERKKERTDAHANDREVYVSQLSRFAAEIDLQRLFSPCGAIKRINIGMEGDHCKGFAFIEFEEESSVEKALELNGHELKKRKIAVQKSEAKAKGLTKRATGRVSVGQGRELASDFLTRSIRLKNLPEKTQEGLLQQALEKITTVKVLQVFEDLHEATAELGSAADVGSLLLRTEPFEFNGATIEITNETDPKRRKIGQQVVNPTATTATAATKTATSFVPRPPKNAAKKRLAMTTTRKIGTGVTAPTASGTGDKGQDDFRRMLLEGKKA